MLKTKWSRFQSGLFPQYALLAEVLPSKFMLGKIHENLSSLFCSNSPLAVLLLVLSAAVFTAFWQWSCLQSSLFQGKGSLQILNNPKTWINNQTGTQQLRFWGLLIISSHSRLHASRIKEEPINSKWETSHQYGYKNPITSIQHFGIYVSSK